MYEITQQIKKEIKNIDLSTLSFLNFRKVVNYGGTYCFESVVNLPDPINWPKSDNDRYYVVEKKDKNRLDNISYFLYNTPYLKDFIAYVNDLADPLDGSITTGLILYIPAIETIYMMYRTYKYY